MAIWVAMGNMDGSKSYGMGWQIWNGTGVEHMDGAGNMAYFLKYGTMCKERGRFINGGGVIYILPTMTLNKIDCKILELTNSSLSQTLLFGGILFDKQYYNQKDPFNSNLDHKCFAQVSALLLRFQLLFFEVSALLDVRHYPKLQSCAISRKNNDATLRKWQKL